MQRSISSLIVKDLANKIVLLTGPRQSGKTTISKQLNLSYDYLNLDNEDHFFSVKEKHWDRSKDLLILDEFHKFKYWKQFIKGVYDTEGLNPKIVITGSAKLDTFKNVGDSLAGRYFQYRLHPLDLCEICNMLSIPETEAFTTLTRCGGFPEPFLKGSEDFYNKWHRTHTDIILQQDLIDLTAIKSIKTIKIMASLLMQRIGQGINYSNIAADLQASAASVKSWLDILENMYMFFKITPYHHNVARSLIKEPKIYCFDIAAVKNEAAQLENIVALSILKRLHYLEDTKGSDVALHYCRTKDGKEIDFLVKINSSFYLIEVKTSANKISANFSYFSKFFPKAQCIQLVKNLDKEYSNQQGYKVLNLIHWLVNIEKNLV